MRRINRRALLSTAVLCGALSDRASAQRTRLLVQVPVAARIGTSVQDPCSCNFEIKEDGVSQSIESCSPDVRPVSLWFLVDTSGSMRPYATLVRETMRSLLALSSRQNEHALFLSAGAIKKVEPPADYRGTLADLLTYVEATGRTSIVDHVRTCAAGLARVRGSRRIMLVFSDGMDNLSESSAEETTRTLLASHVTLFSFDMFGPNMIIGESSEHSSTLRRLAERTGGMNFPVRELKESLRAAVLAAELINGSSVAQYYSPRPSLDGSFRRIRIESRKESGRPRPQLHYPLGYYAPNQ